eukprot:13691829-Alexandrium_andersonii.AAC.2
MASAATVARRRRRTAAAALRRFEQSQTHKLDALCMVRAALDNAVVQVPIFAPQEKVETFEHYTMITSVNTLGILISAKMRFHQTSCPAPRFFGRTTGESVRTA